MISTNPNDDHAECDKPVIHSIPRGFLRFLILSLLRSEELTGSEIMNILEERSGGHWKPSPGSIYPLLEHLREMGLIEIASEVGRSKRYRISDDGKDHFKMMAQKKGDLDHKTRLSRHLWIHLLTPPDQAHFHLSGIKLASDFLEETMQNLNRADRQKLAKRLDKLIAKLTEIRTMIDKGE